MDLHQESDLCGVDVLRQIVSTKVLLTPTLLSFKRLLKLDIFAQLLLEGVENGIAVMAFKADPQLIYLLCKPPLNRSSCSMMKCFKTN